MAFALPNLTIFLELPTRQTSFAITTILEIISTCPNPPRIGFFLVIIDSLNVGYLLQNFVLFFYVSK